MKSLIFIAAFCVVAAIAESDEERYDKFAGNVKRIIEKCGNGMQIEEKDFKDFVLGQSTSVKDQAVEFLVCVVTDFGLMDGSELRTEKMCQMAEESYDEDAAERTCNLVRECAAFEIEDKEPSDTLKMFIMCILKDTADTFRKGVECSA